MKVGDNFELLNLQAIFEPPCFQNGPQDIADWGKLLADCQGALTRLSVTRLLTEGHSPTCKLACSPIARPYS